MITFASKPIRKITAIAAFVAAGFATDASAQLMCRTAVGDFPMMLPPGVPLIAGVPCNGHAGPGITIFAGAHAPHPGSMPAPFPVPAPFPQGGPAPFPMPHPFPNGPFQQPAVPPQHVGAGQLAGAFGVNREGQIAAQCVSQFGMTWAAAGCVTTNLTVVELNKCFTDGIGGRGCFGDNNTLVHMIRANFEAAQRERGALNQTIRATTGISVRDIERHGPLGGPNSDARKLCNGLAGIVGGRC